MLHSRNCCIFSRRSETLSRKHASDLVPYPYPMKPCKITEDKQLHTTSKELVVVAMTRRKNSDEKSDGGPCCEGLDRGITSI